MKTIWNLIIPIDDRYVGIKQATDAGFIVCPIGGGGRFKFTNIKNTQRKSAR